MRSSSALKGFVLRRRTEVGAAVALVIALVVFSVLNSNFASTGSLGGVLTIGAELGIMALGVGLLMIAAEIDISISAVFTMGAIVMGQLVKGGMPGLLALAITLAFGAAAGGLNALATLKAGIPSLIATLGTLALWTGIALAITGGDPVTLFDPSRTLNVLSGATVGGSGMHVSVFWWLGLAVAVFLVLEHSAWGNWVYATGGNGVAAQRVGIPVARVKTALFVFTGMLAALAGVVSLGRNTSASPVVTSNNLEAIAAAVIGGVSIWGPPRGWSSARSRSRASTSASSPPAHRRSGTRRWWAS